MTHFVTRVSAHDFLVGAKALEGYHGRRQIGHLIVTERQVGNSPAEVDSATPKYGFELLTMEGERVGFVAPGWAQSFTAMFSAFMQAYSNAEDFKADWVELDDVSLTPINFHEENAAASEDAETSP